MKTASTRKKPGLVKSSLLKWLGVPTWLTDHDFVSELVGASSTSGIAVDHQKMLTLSAVWACTRLISQTIGTLPLSMYERTGAGKRIATAHPLHSLIHVQPNTHATAAVFWESVVAAMLLRGVAHVEKQTIGDRVVGLVFLSPARLSVTTRDRKPVYRYREENGETREIPEKRIWTIPGFSLDGKNGVSVIRYGANVFGSALAADRAAASTFEKGLMPTVALSYPKVLQPNQRDEMRTTLRKLGGAASAGDPVIMEAETSISTIGINPNDAQLLESRGYSVEEVCRWFGVDPTMIGHGEKASHWGTGLEQKVIGFLTFTLTPLIARLEQAIQKDLQTPPDRQRFYPKAIVEGLLRADSSGRAAFYSSMVNNGIMTRDEVRELEDREPMGGNAAVLTVQTALAPLNTIGETSPDRRARAALLDWLQQESAAADAPAE